MYLVDLLDGGTESKKSPEVENNRKVGMGKAPAISRNRCICFDNDPIEYILSCRQSNKIYPPLCKSILHIDTKHN